jgi:DNA invertase Pin-like site-specific DNA recombinase
MKLYLDQQSIDTTTPAGKLLFQLTGAFAEFERSMIRQRVRAGLNVIKEKIARDGKFTSKAGKVRRRLGRPGAEVNKLDLARQKLMKGTGIGKTARLTGSVRGRCTSSSGKWWLPDRAQFEKGAHAPNTFSIAASSRNLPSGPTFCVLFRDVSSCS